MKWLGFQFRRADHLKWRVFDPTRDKVRGDSIPENLLVPVRKEDCRDKDGGGMILPEFVEQAPCLPDLSYGGQRTLTRGPWKERHTGWGMRYTRTLYLVDNGNVHTATERRDNPPVEA